MKVPTLTNNRVAEGEGRLGYSRVPSNLGQGTEMLSRAISNFGGAISQYEAGLKAREEKTNRFNALTALNAFETESAVAQTEAKRNADPSGKNFKYTAEQLYDQRAQEFLKNNIPEELREEFSVRLSQNKQALMNDAYKFQYEQGDAWYRKGISDQLDLARTEIDQNPGQLAKWQENMKKTIDATDLSEVEKAELHDKVAISLAATEYKTQIRNRTLAAQDIGVGPVTDDIAGTKAILRKQEGFRTTAYWDVNAYRTGFGSDTVTRADGTIEKVTKDTVVTREDAERDLQRRLDDVEGKKAREQLHGVWENLKPNVRAALYSVAYNYGSLPASVVKAAREGTDADIADAVAALPANKGRRQTEAAIIRGTSDIDLDDKYSVIPFDDRVALRNDAERQAKADYDAITKAQEDARIARVNELNVGLFDGTKGQADIQAARDSGDLTDFDEIKKSYEILKTKEGQVNLSTAFTMDRVMGRPYDPTNEEDRKKYNAWVGPEGLNKLSQRDEQYFQQSILSPFAITGAMATDVAGLFQGMVRGGNQQNKVFALDALAQMRDVNPVGFASQIPENIQREVDAFDTLKGSVENQAELLDRIAGGTTQVERSRNEMLRKEAQANLSKTDNGVPTIKTLLKELEASYDDWSWGTPHFYTNPGAALAVQTEFNDEYIKQYGIYGDHDKAVEAATKTIKSTWKVSAVGDSQTVMKYPPEMVGYQPSNGSYEWINQQVRKDFNLAPDQGFELISDDLTRQEWEQFRAGVRETPPSYRVIIKDANGVMRDGSVQNGRNPGIPRIYFQKPAELLLQEDQTFDIKNEIQSLSERLTDIVEMKMMNNSINTGKQLPEEIQKEEEEIRNRLRVLQEPSADSTNSGDSWSMPSTDAMGNTF